jgi:hypothetical protein
MNMDYINPLDLAVDEQKAFHKEDIIREYLPYSFYAIDDDIGYDVLSKNNNDNYFENRDKKRSE